LIVPDEEEGWAGAPELGSKILIADPRVRRRIGHGFVALLFTHDRVDVDNVITLPPDEASPAGSLYLLRPDGHIAARRRNAGPADLPALIQRALGESFTDSLQQHAHVTGDVDHDEALPQPVSDSLR
jgi:hypothetical protein